MAAKRRIRKHELKEDRFVTATFQLTSYVREHQNTFIAVLAGVVILAIAIAVVTASRSRTQETVGRLLAETNALYQVGKYQEAIQRCQTVLDQFGGTRQAGVAAFFLGDSQFKLGEYQKAMEAFRLYVDKYHQDPMLTASSLTGIAACHEQMDQFSEAGEFYQLAATKYPDYYAAPEALLNAGRCFAQAGETEKARTAYEQLIENYPDNRHYSEAKMAAAELRGT